MMHRNNLLPGYAQACTKLSEIDLVLLFFRTFGRDTHYSSFHGMNELFNKVIFGLTFHEYDKLYPNNFFIF